MKLGALTKFFEDRLVQEMPGRSAHELMKPTLANGSGIRTNNTTKPRPGGVLILFYEQNGIVKFPLIERPEYSGIHSGQIALPGGKKEEHDADLTQTALRESEEEIGIDKHDVHVLGSLSQFFVAASNFDILPVIGVSEKTPNFKPDPREVNDIITPSITELLDDSNKKVKDMEVRNGYRLKSPYFDLQNKVVWGATAMMLSELVAVVKEFREQ
jgi:8-oxo-dGTP pyrophosphatase MutT (NUDIX family)